MKRALALIAAAGVSALFSTAALADGPSITASIYAPDVDVGPGNASPDGLLLEIRQPLNRNFWLGATLGTTLGEDQIAAGIDTELGASFAVNLGVQTEFTHNVFGYAYLGYGAAKVLMSSSSPLVPVSDVDGKGVAFGAGMQFLLGDHMLVDAGYASLFDGDMEDSAGTSFDTTIAGPRVGLGFRF